VFEAIVKSLDTVQQVLADGFKTVSVGTCTDAGKASKLLWIEFLRR